MVETKLPIGWRRESATSLGDVQTGPFGTLLKASEYGKYDGVPILSVGEIGDGRLNIGPNTPLAPIAVVRRLPVFVLKTGDIVLGRKGGVDRSALITEASNGWFLGSDGIRIRPDKQNFSPFFAAQLQQADIKTWLLQHATGTTMATLSHAVLSRLQLVFPPLPEQRAIAEALSDVDALIAGLDRLIAKKHDIKHAAMQQLLTGKTRLPGFGGDWETINMAKSSTLKARIGWQGLTTAEYQDVGSYYLVTGTDFQNGEVAWSTCHFVDRERYVQDRNIQLRPNDVLITKDGTIGKVGFIRDLPGPATLNSGVFVMRPIDEAYDPQFLFYVLTSRVCGHLGFPNQ